MEHPFETGRRKEPVSKLLQDAFSSLDHVLGYLTSKGLIEYKEEEGDDDNERAILGMFTEIVNLKMRLEKIVPKDDF